MQKYRGFVLIVILLCAGILYVYSFDRYRDFRRYHTSIAERSAREVSSQIENYIIERQRLVRLFAERNKALIQGVLDDPESEEALTRLRDQLTRYFPLFFAVMLADNNGNMLLDDFDGLVGDVCRSDIQQFVKTGSARQKIHPNSHAYHFDVITRFDTGKRKGVLFVSFKSDVLARMVRASEVQHHNIWVIDADASYLMEVTAKGARDKTFRKDYRMTSDEKSLILAYTPVRGTVWSVVDMHEKNLFSSFRNSLVLQALGVMLVLVLVSVAMLRWLSKEEKRRRTAERARDDFMSTISHELRTPLTAIKGASGMLVGLNVVQDKQSMGLLDMISRNSERLTTLVNDLLDLRKMQAGRMEFRFDYESLCEVLAEAVEDSRSYAADTSVTIRLDCNLPHDTVRMDRGRLLQAVLNLVSNAIKYGSVNDCIEVSGRIIGDVYEVSVTDHGEGIPAEHHDMIFDKFTRIESGLNSPFKGTGLGLSIVEHIVVAHGGEIGLESKPGEGSRFWFRLPVDK